MIIKACLRCTSKNSLIQNLGIHKRSKMKTKFQIKKYQIFNFFNSSKKYKYSTINNYDLEGENVGNFQYAQKQNLNYQSKRQEIKNKIKFWSQVNRGYLLEKLTQLKKKPDHKNKKTQIRKQAGYINKQRPINTINSLIMLLKDYNNRRLSFIKAQKEQKTEIQTSEVLKQMNAIINENTVQIISTLHYMVSSLQFNFGAYGQNQSQKQIEFPFIGTLIGTLVEMLSFNCQQNSSQFDKVIMSIVELLDLYQTSYIHLINSQLEHLHVNDACGRLAKMKVNCQAIKIDKLLRMKYNKKQIEKSTSTLFHKSFLANKNLPAYAQSHLSEYSYTYGEVDESYFMFIQDQIRKIVLDTRAKRVIQRFEKQIDTMIELDDKWSSKLNIIKNIPLYIEWIRMYHLYGQVDSTKTPKLLLRIQFCIANLIQFIKYSQKMNQTQMKTLSSGLFNVNCQESLIYLNYFYLVLSKNLTQSEIIDQNDVVDFKFMVYDFIKKQFNKFQKNHLLQCQANPKTACIQMEILYSVLRLQEELTSKNLLKKGKTIKQSIKTVLFRYISSQIYKNFPYLYLTWFYDRFVDLLNKFQNDQQIPLLKRNLLFSVIDAIMENKLNKLSNINKIHSILPVISHLLQNSKTDQSMLVYHNKVLAWLSSHSRQQLLTQEEDELCDIFEYFHPVKRIYCEFLTIVVNVSFGEFNWQGFNKLYYHCLVYYSFEQTEHKLKTHEKKLPHSKKSEQIDSESMIKQASLIFDEDDKREIKQDEKMNMEYMRRYILNEYNAMGVRRREVPLTSYFYKILQLETPQTFYKNYFENYGNQ